MNEWKKVKISDIGKVITGKTPKTSNSEYYGGNIPFLTPSDDMSVKYSRRTNKYITELGRLSVKNATLPPNAICVSCIGSDLGKVVITTQETVTNQQINSIVVDTDKFDIDFVYYSMLELGKILNFHSKTSTAVPIVNKSNFSQYEINCPGLDVQKKIGFVLSSIDKKIEKNEKINNNLEQQADALYRKFFSPQSGTHGEIVTLDHFCSIFTGKKNANASVNKGKYKFFTCAPESLQIDSYIFDGNAIIVSGNGAYTGRTRFYSGKFDLYQRTYACTLLQDVNPDYIFPLYWFVKLELSKKIMGGTRGSAIPYIVMNDLAKFEFIYNKETFLAYMPIFKTLTETIQANEFENENLANLRDSLLPRLMSGEIDVSDIEL